MNWFSAASLRGLIGHQTAPAREMPNTQANATGSLPDRIATFSPGSNARNRASPRAIAIAQALHLAIAEVAVRPWSGTAHRRRARRPCPGSRQAAWPTSRSRAGDADDAPPAIASIVHGQNRLARPVRSCATARAVRDGRTPGSRRRSRPAWAAAAAASTRHRPAACRSACSCCCRG